MINEPLDLFQWTMAVVAIVAAVYLSVFFGSMLLAFLRDDIFKKRVP